MVQEQSTDIIRINARRTDVFDIFNFTYFIGPNPYLDTGALVFDFALTEYLDPLPIQDYIDTISHFYPHLAEQNYQLYADLFACIVSEVGKLDMGLYLNVWSIKPYHSYVRISIQALHERTARGVVYLVWDWLESITKNEYFPFEEELLKLQNKFRESIYGGPTVYALWQAAHQQGIPTFYLWEEGLMQYGYGKKQIRGVATSFHIDSHLDSEFTTRKDDCKEFLDRLGFPIPNGDIVISETEALDVAIEIGYPVAVKPVVGHKGIGVTANVQDSRELEYAYHLAKLAISEDKSTRIIIEKSISGTDYRLLCINGKFIAATERRPPSIIGDGYSTVRELIDRENCQPERKDTPTSPMSQIIIDEVMEEYLYEQRLRLDSIVRKDETIYLSPVANISSGGVSINATDKIHPDNIILAEEIAQNFGLTCLGIDVIAHNISQSWQISNFAILEINAAPGISMHLNPAIGASVDVPAYILSTFFPSAQDARIPIITFNQLTFDELQIIIDRILFKYPQWTIGGVCREGILVNHSEKLLSQDYNRNIQTLLRNPQLDLLIAEYPEDILETDGMVYKGSNIVVLDHPTETEMMLLRDAIDGSIFIISKENHVSIQHKGLIENLILEEETEFLDVYLQIIDALL
ncbi:cyanophycin synthetase [Okeanomitos corallinicola TIOX110]|uniref:Cyanophycin synthetase n=1 Tax=Okeanomitos corallinicola TIOX110 TaxID=3133117 RepID=A0ABZ2ULT1_9CYAN